MDGQGFLTSVKAYLAHPYSDDMSAFDWFLFTGLLLLFSLVWAFMIHSITAID